MRSRSSRVPGLPIGVALAVVLAISAAPLQVNANLSVPTPLWFWDPDDNYAPGPEPKVDADGSYWSTSHLNRLNEVVAEWSGDTDFDIGTVGSGSQKAYVDGRLPPCSPDGFNPPGGTYLAVVCRAAELRSYPYQGGNYYRITDLDLYFNMENPDSPNWWVGATYPPESRLHFAGVLTHELGHWVRLLDIPDSSCTHTAAGFYTMCGTVLDPDQDTWRMTSLHSDDIASANYVYP
jgi:hypothetical protein